jgi:poly(A) polymerase
MHGAELLAPVIAAGREGMEPDASLVARVAAAGESVHELSGPQLNEALTFALCGRHPQLAIHKDVWEHTKMVVWRMFLLGPAHRLGFAPQLRERIAELIRWHLSRADITSRRSGRRKRCLRMISELGRRIRELEAEAEYYVAQVRGRDLLAGVEIQER